VASIGLQKSEMPAVRGYPTDFFNLSQAPS
jgi:hypothetical protein